MAGIAAKLRLGTDGPNMSDNLEVRYLYRDGGNNKKYQSVVLANRDDIKPEQLE